MLTNLFQTAKYISIDIFATSGDYNSQQGKLALVLLAISHMEASGTCSRHFGIGINFLLCDLIFMSPFRDFSLSLL
jgi:hypothetical protein